jgi:hypothetical protein
MGNGWWAFRRSASATAAWSRMVSSSLCLRKTTKGPRWKVVDHLQVHLTDLAHLTSSEPLERALISLSSTFFRV